MVQKFVKELNDSAKQPDRSDSAEHTATEQVETTAREIVHDAVQLPRSFAHRTRYTESTECVQPEPPAPPHQKSVPPRQRAEDVRTRPDIAPRSTPAPTPQEQGRRTYVQQATKAAATPPITPELPQERPAPAVPTLENVPRQNLQFPRQRTENLHTCVETRTPQSTPAPTPQEQGRRAYIQQAAKAAATPPITPESPQEHPAPVVPTPENSPRLASETPRLRADDIRLRPESEMPQHTPTPAPQELGRRAFTQKAANDAAKAPVRESLPERPLISDVPTTEKLPRLRIENVRTRPDAQKPQNAPAPTAQEQGRRACVQQAKKSRAEKSSARDNFHAEKLEICLAEDLPEREPPRIREKPTITELRGEQPSEPTPEKAPNVRHIKQTDTWTPRDAERSTMRGVELPIREHIADTPAPHFPPQSVLRRRTSWPAEAITRSVWWGTVPSPAE